MHTVVAFLVFGVLIVNVIFFILQVLLGKAPYVSKFFDFPFQTDNVFFLLMGLEPEFFYAVL